MKLAPALLFALGCGGSTTTPPVPPPTNAPAAFACPATLPNIRTGCPGLDVTSLKMVCTSATSTTGPVPPPSTGSRIGVTIGNFTTINGVATPIGPTLPCGPNGMPSNGITVTLGAAYVADFGSPAVGAAFCLARSKTTYTQWGISDPLVAVFDSELKSRVHLALDQTIVDQLNSALGLPAGLAPRCANWRQMP